MTDDPFNQKNELFDKGPVSERLALVEQLYPGAKTVAFYDAIEGGVAVERPNVLLTPEHAARTTLDKALGDWVVDGSFEALFVSLEPIIVEFSYGGDEPSEEVLRTNKYSPEDIKILTTFTPEQQKYLPLARLIVSVSDALTHRAPLHLAQRFTNSVEEQTWQRDLGFTLDDLCLQAGGSVERFKNRFNNNIGEKIDLKDRAQRKAAACFETRMELIELQYPGPKTTAFYDAINELTGLKIDRPKQLLFADNPARALMEQTIGKWLVDGSYDEVLKTLTPLALEFHYGFLPSVDEHDSSLPISNVGIPLTTIEKQNLALARIICAVTSALIENAPKAIGDRYAKILDARVDQRMFEAHPWLREEQDKIDKIDDAEPKNPGRFNPWLNCLIQSAAPVILSLISFLA